MRQNWINKAEKPLLYVGGGAIISGEIKTVRAVAEKGNIPCTTTLLGMGSFDETSPLAMHMLGMHGSAYANYAVQECDCLIAVGAHFRRPRHGSCGNLRTECEDHSY